MMPGKSRKHIVQTTLNDREYSLFCRKAEHEGMSMAGWARVLIVRGCRPSLGVPFETMEPRIGTPEREVWQREKNERAQRITDSLANE